jgi:murein DD-endopeptidase MepM/ murein hydrolase activator NlpD
MRLILPAMALALFLAGLVVPAHPVVPVQGAGKRDWHPKSFWFSPWGPSGVHKGIDIFAKEGTPVLSSVPGFVLFTGKLRLGGNVVGVLGPKWRIHYYAHLDEIRTTGLRFVSKGDPIGTVGSSGNAAGKPPHLHYAIVTPIPYPWRAERGVQGWRKMFYLNPIECLSPVAPAG